VAINVAYDITVLGRNFNRVDCKTGIFRVIEEVMYEMLKRQDIELTLMGLCSDDFLFNFLASSLYVESLKERINCNFVQSFKSRLGLSNLYLNYFDASLTKKLQEEQRFDPKWIIPRLIRRGLHNIHKLDVVPNMDFKSFDIFHSPHLKLPPEELTGNIPRLLTVYDLIPVITPNFVVPELTEYFTDLLNSINIHRDWIVCISEYTKQEFCEYMKMSPDRVFVAPLAAADHFYPARDTDRISTICKRYNIPEGNYFLSIAAPQPRKNLIHLIHCFFRLLSEQPELDVNLVLVGSKDLGWMNEDIFAAVNDSSIYSSRVIFTGYIPDEDLSEVYSGATAFIFPSLYEGFGLPPLEAMQCGTPVISSNATSLPEVVGDAGILVGSKDEDSLCQAMLDILNNTTLQQELSRKGLERASQFTWAKCAADTVEVYKTAIN